MAATEDALYGAMAYDELRSIARYQSGFSEYFSECKCLALYFLFCELDLSFPFLKSKLWPF